MLYPSPPPLPPNVLGWLTSLAPTAIWTRFLLAISDVSIPSCGVYCLIRSEGWASQPMTASQEFDRLQQMVKGLHWCHTPELLRPSLSIVVHSGAESSCLHNKRYNVNENKIFPATFSSSCSYILMKRALCTGRCCIISAVKWKLCSLIGGVALNAPSQCNWLLAFWSSRHSGVTKTEIYAKSASFMVRTTKLV